jgi:hypothetical protein
LLQLQISLTVVFWTASSSSDPNAFCRDDVYHGTFVSEQPIDIHPNNTGCDMLMSHKFSGTEVDGNYVFGWCPLWDHERPSLQNLTREIRKPTFVSSNPMHLIEVLARPATRTNPGRPPHRLSSPFLEG